MSKLIYADSLRQDILALPNCYNGFSDTYDKACIIGVIDEQQPVDVVEVVRCKDCKFWQNQEEGVIEVPICARPENKYEKLPFRFMIGKDGFCSYAERRSDED